MTSVISISRPPIGLAGTTSIGELTAVRSVTVGRSFSSVPFVFFDGGTTGGGGFVGGLDETTGTRSWATENLSGTGGAESLVVTSQNSLPGMGSIVF